MGLQRESKAQQSVSFDPTMTPAWENVLPFHQVKTTHFHSRARVGDKYPTWKTKTSQQDQESSSNPQDPVIQAQEPSRSHIQVAAVLFSTSDLNDDERRALKRFKDFGAPLNLEGFSEEQLIQNFRYLAKTLHPDMHCQKSENERHKLAHQFHEMRETYNVLKKAISRLKLDQSSQAA